MTRMAIFVEGYTEIKFVMKLIEEVAGQNRVLIEHREIRGGGKDRGIRRTMARVQAAGPDTGQKHFILILDCGSDDRVKTQILYEHANLTKAGYTRIVGLRDVRPRFSYADIPRLERGLRTYIKTALIPVDFVLAIMEIEAWFLAETTHYARIDPAITVAAIKSTLGFDPENDDMEQRPHPAGDLHNCYAMAGKAYLKGRAEDTVNALDFAELYCRLTSKIAYLKKLTDIIETFLS